MKTSDPLADLRHEIRSRLQHLLGYGEILKEDARESSAGIDTAPLLALLRSRSELVRGELDRLPRTSLIKTRDTITAGILEICSASRDMLQLLDGDKPGFLRDDIEGMLAAADGLLDYVKEGFALLALPEEPEHSNPPRIDDFSGARRRGRILIVDDNEMDRDILSRHLKRQGHTVTEASSGAAALEFLAREETDLILLDVMMPALNGFQLLKNLKSESSIHQEIPVIMLSAIEDPESIARCLELGAEDFLSKSFDPILLKARVEATLEKKYLRDQERIYVEALLESRTKLLHELSEAALYVRNLLPEPMTAPLRIDWRYFPSAQLGGDSFGYHLLDEDTIAIYLLDVSGHGIGASLLSVSVLNILRHHAVADADFYQPSSVLTSLNRKFRMEDQNNMYFTLWYSVYNLRTKMLRYSSAGSPPAVLVTKSGGTELLSTEGTAVGIDEDAEYAARECAAPAGKLFLFSDGTYEIRTKAGTVLPVETFYELLVSAAGEKEGELDSIISRLRGMTAAGDFEDDLSLVEIRFPD